MKMILADDEVIITKGLQKLIDWSALGIDIVGVYDDGKSAFEGIVLHRPDLALLDISMPGMTGIDILKECGMMRLKTQIVLISGFQDFVYAREAVKWGAADYLLKPVIREELLAALEKCCRKLGHPEIVNRAEPTELEESEYEKLIQAEGGFFQPVLAQVSYSEETEARMRKLTDFSVASCLDNALSAGGCGIAFVKQGTIGLILKEKEPGEGRSLLVSLRTQAKDTTGQDVRFLLGQSVQRMSDVSAAYQACLTEKGRLFFADRFPDKIMETGLPSAAEKEDNISAQTAREALIRTVISRDNEHFDEAFEKFGEAVYILSGEKKEDVCFYFCSVIRQVQTQLSQLGLSETGLEMSNLLEMGRIASSWQNLLDAYRSILESCMQRIQKQAERGERATFLKAKTYIEEHYAEELTLAVLADHVHVNPYYFSAFFKKYAGKNFKAYVNGIRLRHAITLLVSTNKKILEIALEVGFSDTRAFSSAFQKVYHETPNAYRNRIRTE